MPTYYGYNILTLEGKDSDCKKFVRELSTIKFYDNDQPEWRFPDLTKSKSFCEYNKRLIERELDSCCIDILSSSKITEAHEYLFIRESKRLKQDLHPLITECKERYYFLTCAKDWAGYNIIPLTKFIADLSCLAPDLKLNYFYSGESLYNCGYAYFQNGKILDKKFYKNYEEDYEDYEDIEKDEARKFCKLIGSYDLM